LFPSASVALSLPLDELAMHLLRHVQSTEERGFVSSNLTVNINHWAGHDVGDDPYVFLRALTEAWDWLHIHGLVSSREPSQSHGVDFAFITRKGLALLEDPDGLSRLRAERRLDVDLHHLIAERVRSQYLLGEYEAAAFLAMREVEIRVRDLSGASKADLGVPLMQASFREGGPLANPALESGEQRAMMALFWGAIGVFKNPSSHRQVAYEDPTVASEVVLLADLLLRLLDDLPGRDHG
jgi:uncharacterized protein (TIGR02391 family)